MAYKDIIPGATIEYWTVQNDYTVTPRGEKKWLCRCKCGTMRYVLERSLKYSSSKSCGCLAHEKSRELNAYDLLNREFGDLKVVGRSRKRTAMGAYWTCLCKCGYTCEATASELVSGKKTHCGCQSVKNYAYTDITNRKFGRLTALYPTGKRSSGGNVIWHCRCDCQKEIDVSYNDLLYSNLKSCGCQKKEHDQKLQSFLIHVDGTSVDMLKSKKLPTDNTTGYKGVYLVRGKYIAKIVFQKKQYFLGTYERIEDAAAARKEAEKILFDGVAQHYQKWKNYADLDPEWAKAHPISILVDHSGKEFHVTMLPHVPEYVAVCVCDP